MNKKLLYGTIFILIFSLSIGLNPIVAGLTQSKPLTDQDNMFHSLTQDVPADLAQFLPENQADPQFIEQILHQDILNASKRERELKDQISDFLNTKEEVHSSIPWPGVSGEMMLDQDMSQDWKEQMLDIDSIHSAQLSPDYGSTIEEVVEKTENSISIKTTYGNGFSVVQSRTVRSPPKMKLIQLDDAAELNDLIVPVLSESEIQAQKLTGTHVEKRNTSMGLEFQSGYSDISYLVDFGIVRLNFTFEYEISFHLKFPVNITIEHPQAVAFGQEYSLDVTLEPLERDPSNNDPELSVSLDYDILFKIDYYKTRWVRHKWFKTWYWCFWCSPFPGEWKYYWNYYWWPIRTWETGFETRFSDYNLNTGFTVESNYITPIGNRLSLLYSNPDEYLNIANQFNSLLSKAGVPNNLIINVFLNAFKMEFFELIPIHEIKLSPEVGFIGDKKITAHLGVYPGGFTEPTGGVECCDVLPLSIPNYAEGMVQWGGNDADNAFTEVINNLMGHVRGDMTFTELETFVDNHNTGSSIVDRQATKRLFFTIPEFYTDQGSLYETVRFEVENLKFYPGYAHIVPTLSIIMGGLLPSLSYKLNFANPFDAIIRTVGEYSDDLTYHSDFYYSSTNPVYDGNYDFEVNVTALPTIIGSLSQSYQVDLHSLGDREDFIDLEIESLENYPGVTVKFDRNPASYDIRPQLRRTTEPKEPSSGVTSEIINKIQQTPQIYPPGPITTFDNTAIFTIYIPERTNLPPGPFNFTLVATSKGKDLLSLPDKNIRKTFQVNVPEIVELQFTPPNLYGTRFQLDPGDELTLGYSGQNYGNMADNFTIQAILHIREDLEFEWNNSHVVSRYCGGSSSFNGQFSFRYAVSDIYPTAGNYSLDLIATSQQDPSFSRHLSTYIVDFRPDYNVTTSITSDNVIMFADYNLEFSLAVTNGGNEIDSYTITADGWNTYLNYTTRLENLTEGETRIVTVKLTVPDPSIIPVQQYQFRLIIQSEGNSQIYSIEEVNVDFLDPDLTPPGLDPWYRGKTLRYPISNLSLGPSWTPVDDNPDSYSIFVNGTLFMNNSWVNGDRIEVIMKDINETSVKYGEGLFNVTAVFSDTTGNEVIDMVWVRIDPEDPKSPDVGPGSPLPPEQPAQPAIRPYFYMKPQLMEFTSDQRVIFKLSENETIDRPVNWAYPITFKWEVIEDYILNITYYLNGTVIPTENYTCLRDVDSNKINLTHSLQPGALSVGIWNFTLDIRDMNGHNISKTLFLEILPPDSSAPSIVTYPQTSFSQGIGENITFEASDSYPHHWEVLVDGKVEMGGIWNNSVPVNIPVDELSLILGTNNLNLRIYDLSANIFEYSWTLTLTDVRAPEILYSPDPFVGYEHNISLIQSPYWIVIDPQPSQYTIYQNGSLIESGVWSNYNNTIYVPRTFHKAGIYEYTASFEDTSGNVINSTFLLTVTDVIAPQMVPLSPVIYEPNYMANWFELYVNERNPDFYELFRNDTFIDSGTLYPYYQTVLVDLEFHPMGYWEYKLVMTDKFGNSGTGMVKVVVLDYTPPSISGPAIIFMSENSISNLTWTIFEDNPHNYTLYENGTQVDFGSLNTTNGFANLTYELESLELGVHEYVLTVVDLLGSTYSLTSYVHVSDVLAPYVERVGDYTFQEGDPNAKIIWKASETHPASYKIIVEGETIQEGPWIGNNIELPLVGWGVGTYTILLVLTDASGNTAEDQIIVIVEEKPEQETSESTSEASFGSPYLVIFALMTLIIFIKAISRTRRFNQR
ncbi:MAG: hypothetical protein ACXAD7_13850 [Candidatus Kariarchaeaceae archaeon]|jgi:hypothetical protein